MVGGSVGGLSLVVLADRLGKGIRTAPRDALISLSSTRDRLATSFGVHRAMDTAGAMLGPLVAFGLLAAPREFNAVFAVSLCFAIVGLAVLVLFVQNRTGSPPDSTARRPSVRNAARLLGDRRFRTLADRRLGAWTGHDQRRLPVPRAAGPPRFRAHLLPAAVRRLGGGLHGPGHPRGRSGRPRRPGTRVHGRLRAPAARLHVLSASHAVGSGAHRLPGRARGLRGHGRC